MSENGAQRVCGRTGEVLKKGDAKIHFVGILGAGMMPLALLLAERGYTVSGSDVASSRHIDDERITFYRGHRAEQAAGCDLAVYSLAVPKDNPELTAAREAGIPTVSRPELLGALVSEHRVSIGVAGTHGKSTTTAMLGNVLSVLSPTVICGAELKDGGSCISGSDAVAVYEACEYKDAFLTTRPTVALLLNLELDHTDYFRDIDALSSSFLRYASSAQLTVYNADDENLAQISRKIEGRAVSFGVTPGADYRYEIDGLGSSTHFTVYKHGKRFGAFTLGVMGCFNVQNAVGAIAVASELGVSNEEIERGIASFRGLRRRLEKIGELSGAAVFYDYAHHPSEIFAGISAVRASGSERVTVVFCPHTYTRTKSLWDGFVSALSTADRVILTDVFAAREEAIEGINSRRLAEAIGERAEYAETPRRAAEILRAVSSDSIVLMGAGDLYELMNILLDKKT